ncbi:DapH/DapD/GlmU-related protein [Enterobacter asburiae]|uniref:DapH/DapD/GlmU-related protein n=1 Tax=Enterobacter asburiae TaxID=61645 RepID=UPI003D6EDDC7
MAVIKKGESIGANATIFLGITLGLNCLVGTGSVVTKNVSANADIAENPARILRLIKKIIYKPSLRILCKVFSIYFPF